MEPIVIPLMEEPLEKVATNASFSEVGEEWSCEAAKGGVISPPDKLSHSLNGESVRYEAVGSLDGSTKPSIISL